MSFTSFITGLLQSPAALAGLFVLALALGWLAAKKLGASPAQPSAPTQRSPSDDAFIRGVTHLMADHTDEAIEEFTKSVTHNSDTVETYMVLGNLFRQKGEIERAVRIRQSIILRPNIDPAVRLQAMFDLGMDFKKGGLYNRAVASLEEVLALDPKQEEALRQMVSMYEEMRDWDNAALALKRLDKLTGRNHKHVLAHYQTERGKELAGAMQLDKAESAFNQAISINKECLDAYLHLGDLELTRGREKKALAVWRKAVKISPEQANLVVNRVAAAEDTLEPKAVSAFFDEIESTEAGVATLVSHAERHHQRGELDEAVRLLDKAIDRAPGMLSAHKARGEILLEQKNDAKALGAMGDLLAIIGTDGETFECRECGHGMHQLVWKCPRCHRWDTMEAKIR